MLKKKVLLLTGCAGFIGFNFLKYLSLRNEAQHHYDIVIDIDKSGYATTYNLPEYKSICQKNSINAKQVDINHLNENDRKAWLGDTECVFDVLNFASESHVDNSIKRPFQLFEDNALITSRLINFCGIENIKKFVQISTDEVYGEIESNVGYDDWFSTDSQYNPNNPYSASKLSQDAFLMSMKHTFNMNVCFIRMANQFGPYQHPEKMLPASILRSLKGEPIKIYGNGENIRQWTPVKDTVKVIFDYLIGVDEYLSSLNPLFLAMKNKLYNNNQVVEIWREILDEFNISSSIEYIEDRKGHDKMYALQTDAVVDMYYSEKTLRDHFKETIAHYIENRDRYL